MGQVIDLANYRSNKACDKAIQGIRQKNMALALEGLNQLLKDAEDLSAEADRLHAKRKEQTGAK